MERAVLVSAVCAGLPLVLLPLLSVSASLHPLTLYAQIPKRAFSLEAQTRSKSNPRVHLSGASLQLPSPRCASSQHTQRASAPALLAMTSSPASSSSPTTGRDDKIVRLLAMTFAKLDDFKEETATATSYAVDVAAVARTHSNTDEDFRDQVMSIVANVKNLNGQIRSADSTISAAELAVMDANSMRSHQQKKQVAAVNRKRAREQTNVDKTSLHCTKCGLVRRDRLNINELALDSEECGSHFDYNFDNVCTCSHSSEEESSTDTDGDDDDKSSGSSRSNSSTSRSGSESN